MNIKITITSERHNKQVSEKIARNSKYILTCFKRISIKICNFAAW